MSIYRINLYLYLFFIIIQRGWKYRTHWGYNFPTKR